jgi:hypothetical protein
MRAVLAVTVLALAACGGPGTVTPPAPTETTSAPTVRLVRAGAFCKPLGGLAQTSTGRRVECRLAAGEDRPRWRTAR